MKPEMSEVMSIGEHEHTKRLEMIIRVLKRMDKVQKKTRKLRREAREKKYQSKMSELCEIYNKIDVSTETKDDDEDKEVSTEKTEMDFMVKEEPKIIYGKKEKIRRSSNEKRLNRITFVL